MKATPTKSSKISEGSKAPKELMSNITTKADTDYDYEDKNPSGNSTDKDDYTDYLLAQGHTLSDGNASTPSTAKGATKQTTPASPSSAPVKVSNTTSGPPKNGTDGSDYQYDMADAAGEDYDYTALVLAEQKAGGSLISMAANQDYSDTDTADPPPPKTKNGTKAGQDTTKGKNKAKAKATNSSNDDDNDDISSTVTGAKTIQDPDYDNDLSERSPVDSLASDGNPKPALAASNTKVRDYDYDDYVDSSDPPEVSIQMHKGLGSVPTSSATGKPGSTASPKSVPSVVSKANRRQFITKSPATTLGGKGSTPKASKVPKVTKKGKKGKGKKSKK